MTCTECVERLSAYLDDDLHSRRARSAIDAHLSECSDCRVYLQNLRTTIHLARDAYARESAAPPGGGPAAALKHRPRN